MKVLTWKRMVFPLLKTDENKKSLKIVQEKPSELSKLLFNLEEMVDREDDGDYEKHFKEIGEKYGPFDLTLMECGQYDIRWPNIHMFP